MFAVKNPVIAAVKSESALLRAAECPVDTVFLLAGSLSTIAGAVETLKRKGKRVFVHVDLIDGLRPDKAGLTFLAAAKPAGIISTKPATIKHAAALGIRGALRIFMIDAAAFQTGLSSIESCRPELAEIMPGLMPSVIGDLARQTSTPVVAGGMIKTRAQAAAALESGAVAITTSSAALWEERF